MLKTILNLQGVQSLNKDQRKAIQGGSTDYEICLSTCPGTCNVFGRCTTHLK